MSLIMEVLSKVERDKKPFKADFEQSINTIVLDPGPKAVEKEREIPQAKEPLNLRPETAKVSAERPAILEEKAVAHSLHHVWMFILLGIAAAGMLGWYVIAGNAAVKKNQVVLNKPYASDKVSPSAALLPETRPEPAVDGVQENANDSASYFLKTPARELTLEGLVLDGKDPYCLIRGKILKVGDWLDDKKVVAITPEGVTLNASTGQIVFLAKKN